MKYHEIQSVDRAISTFPERTSLDDFVGEERVARRSYTLPKNTGHVNNLMDAAKKKKTAQRLLREVMRVRRWTPEKKRQALDAIYKLRPNRRQVIAHYIAKGDYPAIARKLAENYEILPVVHLTKKDFHVIRDVINGHVERHRPYIERLLAS